jgi:hypothetical protein
LHGREPTRRDKSEKIRRKDEKNAAEAALKIWRHPSMKESLLAVRSIAEILAFIHHEICN